MDLFEYQGKQYFARYGIPISPGEVADTVEEAVAAAERIGYPVVVKAQVQVGGRGKAGGVKLAADRPEVEVHAGNILGLDIKGHVVRRLWIEHATDIEKEYYASFTLDRAAKLHLAMVSARGGVDIEQVADEAPEAIARRHVNPLDGLSLADARALAEEAGLDVEALDGAAEVLVSLYRCYVEGDADLVEINPLVLTADHRVHALDAKVKAILVNIFGGIVRCDEVARGILTALDRVELSSPIVLRLDGTNAKEAREIIAGRSSDKIISEPTMLSAARRAVEVAAAGLGTETVGGRS